MKGLTLAKRLEISEQLAIRILEDAGFKNDLLRDPRRVLAQAFSLEMPEGIAVEVVADDREVKYMILPFEADAPENAEYHPDDGQQDDIQQDGVVEWYIELLARAQHDEVFRRRLLKNPKAVLSEALQIDLPEDYDIRVLAETYEQRYVLLPYLENCYDSELRDEDLELVVGGKSSDCSLSIKYLKKEGEKVKQISSGNAPRRRRRWEHRTVC